jgi:hypothetical protein
MESLSKPSILDVFENVLDYFIQFAKLLSRLSRRVWLKVVLHIVPEPSSPTNYKAPLHELSKNYQGADLPDGLSEV